MVLQGVQGDGKQRTVNSLSSHVIRQNPLKGVDTSFRPRWFISPARDSHKPAEAFERESGQPREQRSGTPREPAWVDPERLAMASALAAVCKEDGPRATLALTISLRISRKRLVVTLLEGHQVWPLPGWLSAPCCPLSRAQQLLPH